jgi:hypothetical protein
VDHRPAPAHGSRAERLPNSQAKRPHRSRDRPVEAIHIAADPESTTSEVDAVQREARTRIDAAEAAADDALARAETAERAADTARLAQADAEDVASQGLYQD